MFLVGHVRDVDDRMASAAAGGRGQTPPEEQLSEVGGTGGQHQPVGLSTDGQSNNILAGLSILSIASQ